MNKIIDGLKTLPPELKIVFHPSENGSGFSKTLVEFADSVIRIAGHGTELLLGDGEGLPCTPAVTFHHPERGDIHYMALPEGQELTPFREMIAGISPMAHHISDELKAQLRGFVHSTEIMVFITSTCPHCPQAVRAALALAFFSSPISVAVIDTEMFPELTKRYNIRSVPMIILNRELMINQILSPNKLAEHVLQTHTEHHREKVFFSYVETGNIDRATKQLLSDPRCADYFLSAWGKSTLHLRMGLLFASEQVLSQRPKILNPLVQGLIDILATEDISLRGDTADLLGRIGHPRALEPLKNLIEDSNPDIVDIAEEAVQAISASSQP